MENETEGQGEESGPPDVEAGGDATETAELPVVTSGKDAPTVFADGCVFAAITGGVVRLQFVESIFDAMNVPHPGHKIRHVGTIVMPTEGFAATLAYLIDRAKESGLEIPDAPPEK